MVGMVVQMPQMEQLTLVAVEAAVQTPHQNHQKQVVVE